MRYMIKPEICHPGWKLKVSGMGVQDNLVNTLDAPEFICCHPVSSGAGQENNAHLCLRFSKGRRHFDKQTWKQKTGISYL